MKTPSAVLAPAGAEDAVTHDMARLIRQFASKMWQRVTRWKRRGSESGQRRSVHDPVKLKADMMRKPRRTVTFRSICWKTVTVR